jgi:glycosyltransferase involved in cell wall biosynthesis
LAGLCWLQFLLVLRMAMPIKGDEVFFSICIPQYNRTSFLIEALKALVRQSFKNFEVCISDDVSNDGRHEELRAFLAGSGLKYAYVRQSTSLRYDANLRASMGLAQGRYCLLHGNDDCLKDDALEKLHREIVQHGYPAVVIPNFEDWRSGAVTRRIRHTGLEGCGPVVAVAHYRNVAFVTGVILETSKAHALATTKWDGSEMYQMYLMARMIASGGQLLTLGTSLVRKDIQVPGEDVDSYAKKPRLNPCPIQERTPPFVQIGRLVADAIDPSLGMGNKDKVLRKLIAQLYLFTYPFWVFEYRRVQSWRYALGICLGIRPKNVFAGLPVSGLTGVQLRLLYAGACAAGLLIPVSLFDKAKPALYRLAKSVRQK